MRDIRVEQRTSAKTGKDYFVLCIEYFDLSGKSMYTFETFISNEQKFCIEKCEDELLIMESVEKAEKGGYHE